MDACGQGEGGKKRDFFVDVINGWPLFKAYLKFLLHVSFSAFLIILLIEKIQQIATLNEIRIDSGTSHTQSRVTQKTIRLSAFANCAK